MTELDFVLPFGPHTGKTLSEVADTDEGLLYLDNLLGEDWVWPATKEKIEKVLRLPVYQ